MRMVEHHIQILIFQIKDYVMIDGKNFFDQPINNKKLQMVNEMITQLVAY